MLFTWRFNPLRKEGGGGEAECWNWMTNWRRKQDRKCIDWVRGNCLWLLAVSPPSLLFASPPLPPPHQSPSFSIRKYKSSCTTAVWSAYTNSKVSLQTLAGIAGEVRHENLVTLFRLYFNKKNLIFFRVYTSLTFVYTYSCTMLCASYRLTHFFKFMI